jgi:hypothetical protein
MQADKKTLFLPILLIAVGSGWLLTTLGVFPGIDWVWTIGLAAVGILTFIVSGFDKVSVVIGPLFILASCLSILRQTDRIHFDIEVPILVISAGVLLMVARSPAIPIPTWFIQDEKVTNRDHKRDVN